MNPPFLASANVFALLGFEFWVVGTPEEQAKIHARAVGRFLNMLEVDGQIIDTEKQATDLRILPKIVIEGLHSELFSLPLLATAHAWTETYLEGLQTFCGFHLDRVGRELLLESGTSDQSLRK